MREIKFRAWDTVQKRMVHGGVDLDFMGQVSVSRVDCSKFLELIQFTGLKDKNGKEIYEGDIVVNYEGKNPCVVKWGGASVDIKGCGHDEDWSTLEGGWSAWEKPLECYQREVVGNIYENPELLKESV